MQTINRKSIIAFYLDFVNNFLTIERMASHYNIDEDDCLNIVDIGKRYQIEDCITKTSITLSE